MMLAKNRRALYDYEVIEKFLAGIVLEGYEVKAVREGKANLTGSYVQIIGDEPFVVNMKIGRYSKQSQMINPEEERRSRKLLLEKREVEYLQKELGQKGKTAVSLALLLKNNLIKLEFALVKGRKKAGKKQLAKERQVEKDLAKQRKAMGI